MSRRLPFPNRGAQGGHRASLTRRHARDLSSPPVDETHCRREAERRARFLTMRAAAAHAGYDIPDSLYRQLRRDLVPLHRPTARRVLVTVGDLEDWITKNSSALVQAAVAAARR